MTKEEIVESLSPMERKVLPHLREKSLKEIEKKSGLDETSVTRALQFLENKKIIKLSSEKKKIVDLGDNGVVYVKNELPERKLLNLLAEKKQIELGSKEAKLSENELKAALGALKNKALIELKQGKIILTAGMHEISKKMLEEQLLEALPLNFDDLKPEQLHALKSLESRKDIVRVEEEKKVKIELTELGKEIIQMDLSSAEKLLENLSSEMIKNEDWKGKKFRRYDVSSPTPITFGGKRHFVSQAIDSGRKIWTELGFKEMSGNFTQVGFWNFDALFTAQDHPVREIHDTFYIKGVSGKLPVKIKDRVKKAHESGVDGSSGWGYKWNEPEAARVILRTHTTALSAKTLANLKKEDLPAKFFAIGRCFRNDTVDWSHGFEFNQTEGIVVDENANFCHLLGYLKEFAKKMGYEKVRFRPHYFPYTEPSLEGDVWDEKRKKWVEVIAAGIFRPEVTEPLLGKPIPVLAWGPGFDRMMMYIYAIKDFRDIYKNNLEMLRKIKFWS